MRQSQVIRQLQLDLSDRHAHSLHSPLPHTGNAQWKLVESTLGGANSSVQVPLRNKSLQVRVLLQAFAILGVFMLEWLCFNLLFGRGFIGDALITSSLAFRSMKRALCSHDYRQVRGNTFYLSHLQQYTTRLCTRHVWNGQ